MESDIPGVRQTRYRLLGLQAIRHGEGVIVRRGSLRFFIRRADMAEFYDAGEIRSEIAGALSLRPRLFDEWTAAGSKPDCYVVCSDFGGFALMRDWNRTAVAGNIVFYPIVLQDEIAWLGPLVVPGEG